MKNKGFLLASSVGAAFMPVAGHAADLSAPVLKAPPVVVPAASWAGFYIGAHGGVAWQQAHNTSVYTEPTPNGQTTTRTSGLAGGQAGYNWQNGNFVFGIEADGTWLGKSNVNRDAATASYEGSNAIRWMSTVRGRAGLAVGNTMAYITAGVAFGGVKNFYFGKSESKTRTGWAIGGGIEHMFTRNWIFGVEGMFVDLGRSTSSCGVAGTVTFCDTSKASKFSNQAIIGRVKLNYKF